MEIFQAKGVSSKNAQELLLSLWNGLISLLFFHIKIITYSVEVIMPLKRDFVMVKYYFIFGILFLPQLIRFKDIDSVFLSWIRTYFCSDEEEFEDWEKFISFHVSVVHANPYNEIDFEAFVTLYQLLEPLYRSPRIF